jgi:hypothetical protein
MFRTLKEFNKMRTELAQNIWIEGRAAMKIRKYEVLLVLLFCLVSFPLLSQTKFSSQKETAVTATKPFVKMVHSTGRSRGTILSGAAVKQLCDIRMFQAC